MSTLTAFIVGIGLFWIVAYIGPALMVSTIVAAVFIAVLFFSGTIGGVGLIIAAILFAPLALLNVVSIRQKLTAPLFKAFKSVLPEMSSTEREALEAGDVWWEAELFSGRPQWNKLTDFNCTKLTEEELNFLENEVETLCGMIDDWKILHEDKDLPEEVWKYIRENKFMAMLISKKWGGLGFSAYAQSCVVTKLSTRSVSAAVTVMVPNSLGPGELLMHYGTPEQQKEYLPGLVDGTHIPCFGLTGPDAGSDAGAIPDTAVVCKGKWKGKQVLGMKLTFAKRYITLAPVSTIVGLAVKLYDPDGLLGDSEKTDYGITCVLLPSDTKGVEIGRRHWPCNTPFMNGPINGTNVFVPIDWIIGGPEKAGGGWRMLVECLSAGRGVSLPALSTASAVGGYLTTGAYARIRRQFKLPIGRFEGVQEAMGRIAGLAYKTEATRTLTASAVDNCSPSVVTAIAKYHMTEMMRTIGNDTLDIHAGRAVMQGPRNYAAGAFQAIPIAITVEGANILTRCLMIFGQGAIRCHPFVFPEMEAARKDDLAEFDKLLWGHIGFSLNRGIRALTLGLTGARLAKSPDNGPLGNYYKQIERMSAALAFSSDVTMGVLGGQLKFKERLSARLGDVLSHLYMASAVLKYAKDNGETAEDVAHARWALDDSFREINDSFELFFDNFPTPFVGGFLKRMCFPLGRSYKHPSDNLSSELSEMMMSDTPLKERFRLTTYIGKDPDDVTGRLALAYYKLMEVEPIYDKFSKAVSKGEAAGFSFAEQMKDAIAKGILTKAEGKQVTEFEKLRHDAMLTDAFTKDYIKGNYTPEGISAQKISEDMTADTGLSRDVA